MSLYNRDGVWWINISYSQNGHKLRLRQSSGTGNKIDAQRLHDELKAKLWKVEHLNVKPTYTWADAVARWFKEEKNNKKSLSSYISKFKWLDQYLRNTPLDKITKETISSIISIKRDQGCSPATLNRHLAVLRVILRKCEREWEWIDKAPFIKLYKEPKRRIRWLTGPEAARLVKELPEHLGDMVVFSLATGLRQANVYNLQWENVDLGRRHIIVHADESKSGRPLSVPLNDNAVNVLRKQVGKHSIYVFTYKGKPIKQVNTKAWTKALKRAGIENFRWHDLRHTWASWHVMNGTSLQELFELGGWKSFEMVLKYAHLSSAHLQNAASRLKEVVNN